jgi:hypothetical protein
LREGIRILYDTAEANDLFLEIDDWNERKAGDVTVNDRIKALRYTICPK